MRARLCILEYTAVLKGLRFRLRKGKGLRKGVRAVGCRVGVVGVFYSGDQQMLTLKFADHAGTRTRGRRPDYYLLLMTGSDGKCSRQNKGV